MKINKHNLVNAAIKILIKKNLGISLFQLSQKKDKKNCIVDMINKEFLEKQLY